ncbi:MAG: NHL repeat-containing protein [Candidatus Zixiibacteriota bacterium]
MKTTLAIAAILATTTVCSCGTPDTQVAEQSSDYPIPIGLVIEREIKGEILGNVLRSPAGLATDNHTAIYVADAGNSRLLMFDLSLKPIREIGGYGSSDGLLNRPSFMVVDHGLNLWVSDDGNRRVTRFNRRLEYVDAIKFYDDDAPLKFGNPAGIALTEYGETWIADRDKNRIAVFDNVGRFDRFVGDFGYTGDQLAAPHKVLVDQGGNFAVCDAGNGRIVRYDSYGNFDSEVISDQLNWPVAASIGRTFFWVLDGRPGKVLFFDSKNLVRLAAGPTIPGSSQMLRDPTDLIVLPAGRLLVSDSGNNRLLVLRVIYQTQ